MPSHLCTLESWKLEDSPVAESAPAAHNHSGGVHMRKALIIAAVLSGLAAAYGLDPSGFSLVEPTGSGFSPHFSSYMSFAWNVGSGRSWGTGTYVGTTSFLLHPGLTAEVDLGYSRLIRPGADDSGLYLGGVGLDWKPSDGLLLQFHVDGAFSGEALRNY
jgi:hypothetical protein